MSHQDELLEQIVTQLKALNDEVRREGDDRRRQLASLKEAIEDQTAVIKEIRDLLKPIPLAVTGKLFLGVPVPQKP